MAAGREPHRGDGARSSSIVEHLPPCSDLLTCPADIHTLSHCSSPPRPQEEIHPKNLLMIGPTGCGKTEIARRLAKLSNAPFVKVREGAAAGHLRPHGSRHQLLRCCLAWVVVSDAASGPCCCARLAASLQMACCLALWYPPTASLPPALRWRPPSSQRWGSTAGTWTKSSATWWTTPSS